LGRYRGELPAAAGDADGASEAEVFAARARFLGLPFVPHVSLGRRSKYPPHPRAIVEGTFALSRRGQRIAYLAPAAEHLAKIESWIKAFPREAGRLRIATPTAIRAALMDAGSNAFVNYAKGRLFFWRPDLSARRVATAAQIWVGLGTVAGLAVAMALDASTTLVLLNLVAAAFFFGVAVLRFIAARRVKGRLAGSVTPALTTHTDSLPIYTILVPLYREAELVGDIIAALRRLEWPRDKLDIKIIVEADDAETRERAARIACEPPFEVIVVPPTMPRTKPKALTYALPFARGELVTIYDAEDRPHPRQLREAHAVFSRADERLACLQAPIVIDNSEASFISQHFAVEYSALFDGLLPALADLRLPLPLGGTSNHFRREALEHVGGWDPYNVTEDADLGVRLARFGYSTGTITLPTFEEAPTTTKTWMRQRSRWFKGWLQTWLVHTRRPIRLVREIGLQQFVVFALVGIGMIVSAVVHPVYLVTLLIVATDPLLLWGDGDLAASATVGVNLFNLGAGYAAMTILAVRTLALRRRSGEMKALFTLPLYWLLMSAAGYRAVFELALRPHHWEKTPHARRRRPQQRPRRIVPAGAKVAQAHS
jgi:cellulose synthase/poly-beta-1,6-N-acetylglucosamine synthase-like glycosyltransferase